jgi:hypothetical protein
MSTDDVGKFVDGLCNYVRLISLEEMNSHNKQRHNNSSQPHNLIKRINWRIHAMYLSITRFTDTQAEFIKGSHTWSTNGSDGYIQTIEVLTLHNRGVLIRYKTFRQLGKISKEMITRRQHIGVPWWIMTSHLDTSACQAAQPYVTRHRRPSVSLQHQRVLIVTQSLNTTQWGIPRDWNLACLTNIMDNIGFDVNPKGQFITKPLSHTWKATKDNSSAVAMR